MEYEKVANSDGWVALWALVEKGGVSQAAQALHIGQPAVTKRLRALEQHYGVALMERVGGRLRLTPAGQKVYQFSVQLLDRHYVLREELRTLAAGRNSLQLDATMAIGEYLLPDLLLQFNECYAEFKINSQIRYNREVQRRLASGVIDLGLLESAPDHPDVMVQKWLDDELWLVCGASHSKADIEFMPIEELSNLVYVVREKRAAVRETLDNALADIGIHKLRVALEVSSIEAILAILGKGLYVSFMPRFTVEERVRQGVLHHIKVKGFRIKRTLWIARHRAKLNHPVAEAFINMLRSEQIAK